MGASVFDLDFLVESPFAYAAEGILHCNQVVACISSSYQESCRCRTEFEYARLLKKSLVVLQVESDYEPDGWLGQFLQNQVPIISVHDISTCRGIESNLRPFLDTMRNEKNAEDAQKTSIQGEPRPPAHDHGRVFDRKRPVGINVVYSPLDVSRWTDLDVQRWMDRAGFVRQKDKCNDMDGRKLLALKETYFSAPHAYFKELKRILVKPNLEVMLAFTNGLLVL